MARVDQRLGVSDRWTDERTLGERDIHEMHPSSISCRINPANSLIEEIEAKSEEARKGVVGRKAARALILVIDQALENHRASKKHCVTYTAHPGWCQQDLIMG